MLVNPEDIDIAEVVLVTLLSNLKIISSDVAVDLVLNLSDLSENMYIQIYNEARNR